MAGVVSDGPLHPFEEGLFAGPLPPCGGVFSLVPSPLAGEG